MFNSTYSLQTKFYTMSSIPRPYIMGQFISAFRNCLTFLVWVLEINAGGSCS